jgi:hypothetical protein
MMPRVGGFAPLPPPGSANIFIRFSINVIKKPTKKRNKEIMLGSKPEGYK